MATFRLSLLVAMGLVPIACGGTTRNAGKGDGNAGADGNDRGGESTVGTGGSGVGGGTTTTGGALGTAGTTAKGGSAQGGDAGAGGKSFVCESPKLNPQTGLIECGNGGYRHRPTAVDCDNAAGQPAAGGEGPVDPRELPRASDNEACQSDSDCAEFQWGYCGADGNTGPECVSGCITDSDCGDGWICLCGSGQSPSGGECHPADCSTDADCPNSICASYYPVCGDIQFACLTEKDACASNADCKDGAPCQWDYEKQARVCGIGAVCGRPFLVEQAARLPAIVARSDWSDAPTPCLDHLSLGERAELAAHWTKLGQMEHASIAAFARFSLQLLALGAPPDLVDACTQALADETAHTKLCFGLASAYAGRAIGPGTLDVSNSLALTSLHDIVDLVILEGCIGETSAALDALDSADSAADPVIRDAYARIAADEQRHAELAFRFVKWAVTRGGEAVTARVAQAVAALPRDRLCDEVVRPCLNAMLAGAVAA